VNERNDASCFRFRLPLKAKSFKRRLCERIYENIMLRLWSSSINNYRFRKFCKRLPRILSQQLSSLVPTNDYEDKKENDDGVTLLYKRNPKRNTLPRASVLVSSLNSIYWVWYVVDFVPAVNDSPIDNFHIDPIYGFGGLGLSILIQSAFALYPLSLVSKIACRAPSSSLSSNSDSGPKKKSSSLRKQQEILVWKHTLPLLRTSSNPLIFPVGGITMDKTSENIRMILEDLGGNIGKFEGHLGLKRVFDKEIKNAAGSSSSSFTVNFPLLVEIRKSSEVYNSELMLHTLLSRKFKQRHSKGTERRRFGEESDTTHRIKFHQQRTKFQKKKRNR